MKDLRNTSADRLDQMAAEARAEIRSLRFTVGTRARTDVRTLRNAKKNLARILTARKTAA